MNECGSNARNPDCRRRVVVVNEVIHNGVIFRNSPVVNTPVVNTPVNTNNGVPVVDWVTNNSNFDIDDGEYTRISKYNDNGKHCRCSLKQKNTFIGGGRCSMISNHNSVILHGANSMGGWVLYGSGNDGCNNSFIGNSSNCYPIPIYECHPSLNNPFCRIYGRGTKGERLGILQKTIEDMEKMVVEMENDIYFDKEQFKHSHCPPKDWPEGVSFIMGGMSGMICSNHSIIIPDGYESRHFQPRDARNKSNTQKLRELKKNIEIMKEMVKDDLVFHKERLNTYF